MVSVDTNRVVLNSCKDYRPAAKGYINASFVSVDLYFFRVLVERNLYLFKTISLQLTYLDHDILECRLLLLKTFLSL